eukprot:6207823-Pleurochrysis_carterae.AAC.2
MEIVSIGLPSAQCARTITVLRLHSMLLNDVIHNLKYDYPSVLADERASKSSWALLQTDILNLFVKCPHLSTNGTELLGTRRPGRPAQRAG